ncbi:MAG: FAD-dependent oxidoreductase [Clostridia bacterium]|nr:FAD-dependent oxidoreductase [Clostridia bacterium]
MESYQLNCSIPYFYTPEIAVVGGGPAGVCAAIAAARTGAKVLLIESGNCLGGMATIGQVNPFMTSFDKSGDNMIIRGLFAEIIDRLVARGAAIQPKDVPPGQSFTSYITVGHNHTAPFDAEVLKVVLDEMCEEAGVQVLFHSSFISPIMEGNAVRGLVIATKAGLRAVSAQMVIDCTGDADVAFRSGVPCEMGDEASGRIQPATMFFRIGNVDLAKVDADIEANRDNFYRKNGVNYRSFHWRVSEARENGDWDLQRVSIGMFRGVREDEWNINTSRIMGVDGTDPDSVTQAEITGRKQVQEIFRFLKKYVPGCENAILESTPAHVGIRETRHIKGEYVLNTDDVLQGNVPDDSILLAANSIDVHGRYGPMSNEYVTVENGEYYGVPYRCLVPLNVENLLVAGRCVSATSEAAGAIRVMPPCMALGQAAGTAAALALKNDVSVRNLDTALLKETLKKQNAYL